MTRIAIVTSLLLAAVVPVRAEDEPKKVSEELKGEWRVVSYTHSEAAQTLDEKSRVIFTDAKMTLLFPPREVASPFTVDAKSDPKGIDLSPPGEKFVAKGIWKVEKDALTICFAISGGERPKDFKPAKDNSVMVLERVKK